MKKIKLIIIAPIVVLTIIAIYFYITINKMNSYYNVDYPKGLQLKLSKLKKLKNEKIIVVGGSNVNFGIDSDLIEKKLKIPTVNMGIHASLGTMFMLDTIEPYIKNGDIIIISREYGGGLYIAGTECTPYFTYILSEVPYIFKNLKQSEKILSGTILRSQLNLKQYKFEKQVNYAAGVYSFNHFKNDNVIENNSAQLKIEQNNVKLAEFNDKESEEYYKNFYNKALKKGAKVYFSLPNLLENINEEVSALNYYKILSKKTKIPMLSEKKNMYSIDNYLDTIYHLNGIGRKKRTESLIEDLLSQNIKNNTESKFYKIAIKPKKIDLNDFYNFKLENERIIVLDSVNDSLNYVRFREENKNNNDQSIRIEIEAENDILNNIKYMDVVHGSWSYSKIENNKGIFIKEKISNAYYNDNSSYIGFWLENSKKFKNLQLKVNSFEIAETFINNESAINVILEKGQEYFVETLTQKININQIINFGIDTNKFLMPNEKYKIVYDGENIIITNFYNEAIKIKEKINAIPVLNTFI